MKTSTAPADRAPVADTPAPAEPETDVAPEPIQGKVFMGSGAHYLVADREAVAAGIEAGADWFTLTRIGGSPITVRGAMIESYE